MKDTTLVHENSETHPHECGDNLNPESIKDMVLDSMQDKSPNSLDGITVGDGEVYLPPDRLGYQEAAVTGEGEQDCTSYQHAGATLFAEDVGQHMAVLPEVNTTPCEVKIEDIQVGEPGVPLTKEQEELRQLIWKKIHPLMGKKNALPPCCSRRDM
uniref:Reverse transcriptase n=1 Tax=Peronospora matthiolae TaxID=2874970 RepID=A0AAV1VFM4_9STRA